MMYRVYCLGHWIANTLPLAIGYALATVVADIYCLFSRRDRCVLAKNLIIIHAPRHLSRRELRRMERDIFRNFAKYLVDFFRFETIDKAFVDERVTVVGREHVERARAAGKGTILLSAHMGNWELGGPAYSFIDEPLGAVVLTHADKRVNDFFLNQRKSGKVKPIEIGFALRACYTILKKNGVLALLGDRDFLDNGIRAALFGRMTKLPKGPAVLSHRLGSVIVPCFVIREAGDHFRFIFEKPILPDPKLSEEEAVKEIMASYISVLEKYIRIYPTQWYVFKDIWSECG